MQRFKEGKAKGECLCAVFRAAADFANIIDYAQFHLAHTGLRWL
jgi:hypothetical protein